MTAGAEPQLDVDWLLGRLGRQRLVAAAAGAPVVAAAGTAALVGALVAAAALARRPSASIASARTVRATVKNALIACSSTSSSRSSLHEKLPCDQD